MEIILIICVICLAISFGVLLFMILQMNEDFKFLTHKVNKIESKIDKEPESQLQPNIDYEILKEEL